MGTPSALDDRVRARDVREQFVDLVCADEDLLALEFEAIVAAAWPPEVPETPDPTGADGATARPGDAGGRPTLQQHPRSRCMPSGPSRRERSPPRVTRLGQAR